MKIEKKTVVGVVVAIGGVFFVLWLLTRMRSGSSSGNPGDMSSYPDSGMSQPVDGPNLPDVGDLPRPRVVTAPTRAASGCCDTEKKCGGSGYIDSVAPLKIPETYMEAATQAVTSFFGTRSMGSTAPAPYSERG